MRNPKRNQVVLIEAAPQIMAPVDVEVPYYTHFVEDAVYHGPT